MPYAFNPFTGRLDDTGNIALGAVDNAVVRSDGTGGTTTQSSDLVLDDYTAAIQANIHISARLAVFSCTATASDDFVTATGHTYIDGQQVAFSALTGGAGLATATRYFVRDAQAGVRFRVAATSGGTAIDITSDMTAGTVNLATAVGIAPTFGGSFYLGPRPDGTAAGGNAKGIGSVDLQLSRTGAARTASGNFSFVGGGSDNTASGLNSVVLGGAFSTASGAYSAAAGFGAQSTRTGTFAFASGTFTTGGDCQILSAVMRNRTTNATPTELFLDGSAARLTVPSGRILSGTIDCTGTRSDGLSAARFRRSFAIKNVGGTTSLMGTVQTVGTDHEDNASTDITIDADDTIDALRIRVTGIAGETWRWMARIDWSEIVWGT